MMRAHCNEVNAIRPEEFNFDLEQALAAELVGGLVICTARADSRLAAYCVWFISSNLLVKGQKIALQSGWYSAARNSTLGLKLFKFSLRHLRELGVERAFPHFWAASPKPDLIAKFFEKLGGRPAEMVWQLELKP